MQPEDDWRQEVLRLYGAAELAARGANRELLRDPETMAPWDYRH